MKRTKTDHLRGVLAQYMKRRQYQDSEIHALTRRDIRKELTSDLVNMSVRKQSSVSTGVTDGIAVSSITGDFNACDQQFDRLRKFVLESSATQNKELSALLFPIFVHMYSDLLAAGQKSEKASAYKFHERHNEIFHVEEQKDFIRCLRKFESKSELQASKDVADFRERKYTVQLSQASVTQLLEHLKAADNMIILQIINQFINFQVNNTKSGSLELKGSSSIPIPEFKDSKDSKDKDVVEVKKEVKKEDSEDSDEEGLSPAEKEEFRQLKEASRIVQAMPAPLPSICFYTVINAHQGLCTSSISPDSQLLVGGFEDSSLQLWRLQPVPLPTEPTDCCNSSIALAADYVYKEEAERVVDVDTVSQEAITLRAHSGPVYRTHFTPDSKYILSCSRDTTVRLWDVEKRTNYALYRGHSGPVWDMDYCADTNHFATSSRDQTVKLWSLDRLYPLRSFVGHTQSIESVAIHPNGNYVASGSSDKSVRLWSVQDGNPVRLMQGHRASILALAFSPNGEMLASAGEDRKIHIWDLGSGCLLKELRGHTDTVYSLAFSPCNKMLASGGLDCVLRCWDVRRGSEGNSSSLIEGHTSSELLGAFPTKSATVSFLHFSRYTVLLAVGANQ